MLTIIVPYQTSAARQRLQVYLWVGIIMIIYSVLVSIFKVKNRGRFNATLPMISSLRFSRLSFPFVPIDMFLAVLKAGSKYSRYGSK